MTFPQVLPESQKLIEMGARIVLTLLVAFVLLRIAYLIVHRFERLMTRAAERQGESGGSRARTLGQVMRSFIMAIVLGTVAIHVLAILGWDVKPLLAGAGILGVALGFGAQSLVRDWIAGVFILLENQYTVGDAIEVNGRPATVEKISVRSTTLRDFNGYVHFVPNGEMRIITNRSRDWNRIAVDVPVHSSEDIEAALAACRAEAAALNADPVWSARMVEPTRLWGVESLEGGEARIRLVVRARPGPDAPETARELRRRVLRAFAEAAIRYPVVPRVESALDAGAAGAAQSRNEPV